MLNLNLTDGYIEIYWSFRSNLGTLDLWECQVSECSIVNIEIPNCPKLSDLGISGYSRILNFGKNTVI